MLITAKMNRNFGACYSDELLAELYGPEGRTTYEVATLRDGKWLIVPLCDRIWVLQRVLLRESRPGWLEWLARLTERALARVPADPRSMAVVAALRADAVTQEMADAEIIYNKNVIYPARSIIVNQIELVNEWFFNPLEDVNVLDITLFDTTIEE